MQTQIITALAFFLLSFNSLAEDDVLLLNSISQEPPNTLKGFPRPKPGMTKDAVKSVFGVPEDATKPVGDPPISKWIYPGFIVYFEKNNVINTVLKKPNIK